MSVNDMADVVAQRTKLTVSRVEVGGQCGFQTDDGFLRALWNHRLKEWSVRLGDALMAQRRVTMKGEDRDVASMLVTLANER